VTLQLLRTGGILIVLIAAALVGLRPSVYYIAALFAVLACLVLWRGPEFGLAAIVGGLFVPYTVGTGTKTELNISVILVLILTAFWCLGLVVRRDARLIQSRTVAPFLALLAVTILAFLAGLEPWLAVAETASVMAQLGGFGIFVLSAGVFFVAAHQIRNERSLQRLVWIFLMSGALYMTARYLPSFGGYLALPRPAGSAGSVLFTWIVALALSQALFNRALASPWRLGLLGLVAFVFYELFVREDWASGWMPAAAAVGIVIFAGAPRMALAIAGAGAVTALLVLEKLMNRLLSGGNDWSLATRLEAWAIVLEMVKLNPLLGLGPANYYWYAPLYQIRGFGVSFNSHNNYIDILGQTGFLGLACYLWLMVELGCLGWWLRGRVPEGFSRAYVYGALGGLTGMVVSGMLGDWVIPFVYNIGLKGFRASVFGWLFLGGLVMLEQTIRRAPRESTAITAAPQRVAA
jgi:O-antigen ligase